METNRIEIKGKDKNGDDKVAFLLLPDAQINKEAQLVYNRAFRDALDSGAILRQKLGDIMEEQGLWDGEKEALHFDLITNITEWEKTLAAGGIKLEEAKQIAIQMRRARMTFRSLVSQKTSMDANTVEGQADNARFAYLVFACLKNENGEPVFETFDEYENAESEPYVVEAASALAKRLYGLDPDYDKNLPENKFLEKYELVDKDLHLVDEEGRKVDIAGRYVDKTGRFIDFDEDGEEYYVDYEGKKVDADGNYINDEEAVFLDDKGKPIPIPGKESEPEAEAPKKKTTARKKTTTRKRTPKKATTEKEVSQGQFIKDSGCIVQLCAIGMPIFFGVPNMAQKFVLTAQLQLQAPKNVRQVVRDINNQLKGVHVDIDVKGAAKAQKDVKAAADATKDLGKESAKASGGIRKMDLALGKALKQVFRYDIARGVLNAFRRTLEDNVKAAIDFEREMIKVAQVTNQSMNSLRDLQNEIGRLSTNLGVSSASLVKTSRVLAQTGLSAKDVKIALESLAKTTLAPTFDDITDTTETAIAAMRQFKIEASGLERVLGQINAVAGKFAVEAGDIGVAIRRAGGAFQSAGGELEELIALFTSVRATTRETAETIATGFRTIFTRMQRPETIEFLRSFGIELQDLEGKFVGPYEAVNRLNQALKNLDPRDVRYSQIVEQLGGFRQVSKVIPLIQQFGTAQAALNVAQKESGGLSRDALTAQASLAVQIQKLTEDVKELFREIVSSKAFQVLAGGALKLANALVKIGDALAPVLPMLATLGAVKIAQFGFGRIFGGGGGGAGKQFGGRVSRFSTGGLVPGKGNGDTVPALLESGEFVLRKNAVKTIGAGRLASMNRYATGGITKMSSAFARGNILRSGLNPKKGGGAFVEGTHAFTDAGTQSEEDKVRGQINPKQVSIEALLRGKGVLTRRKDTKGRPIKGKYDVAHGYKGLLTSYTGSGSNPAVQGNLFEQILAKSGYLKQGKGFGGRAPLDGTIKGVLAEVKRSEVSKNKILDKVLRHEFATNKLSKHTLTGGSDTIGLPSVMQVTDKLAASTEKMRSFRGKLFAAGGAVGTDTVPSLLTPGEFVINKKSAQSIGYGNLYSMNKMADGGIVGGGGFIETAGGGGGLDITGIMMQFAMLQGVMGGFGSKASDAADGLEGAGAAAGGIKSAMGEMMPVLGNLAQSGMMVYTKWSVLGGIATQVGDSMFGASDAMHNFIFTVQMAGAALEMFSVMRSMDMSGLMSGLQTFGGKLADMAASGFGMGHALMTGAGVGGGAAAAKVARGRISSAVGGVKGYAEGLRHTARQAAGQTNVARGTWARGAAGKKGFAVATRRPPTDFLGMRKAPITSELTGNVFQKGGQLGAKATNKMAQSSAKAFGKFAKTAGNASRLLKSFNVATLAADVALMSYAASAEAEAKATMKSAAEEGRGLTSAELGQAKRAEWAGKTASAGGTGALVGAGLGTAALVTGVASGGTIPAAIAVIAGFSAAVSAAFSVVTGFATWLNGASQAAEEASKLEFAAAVGDWQKAIDQNAKGMRTNESTLAAYGRANDAAAKRAGQLVQDGWFWDVHASDESVAALEEFNKSLIDSIPQIYGLAQAIAYEKNDAKQRRNLAAGDSRLRTTVTSSGRIKTEEVTGEEAEAVDYSQAAMVDFEAELNKSGKTLNEYAVLQGKTVEEVRASIMAEAEAHYKVTRAMEEFDQAMKVSTENLMKSIEVYNAVNMMQSSIAAVDNRMANLASGMDGAVTTGKMGEQFSAEKIGSITTKEESAAFEQRVNALAGEMGTGGGAMATDMIGAQKLMSNVTGALASEKDIGKTEGESMGKRVMTRLESDIDAQFGEGAFKGIPEHLKKKIKSRLDSATAETEGGKDFNEAFEEAGADIQKDLGAAFEPMRKAFEETAKLFDTFNSQLANVYAERRKVEMEIIQAQKGFADMQYQNAERLAKMEGRDMTQADFRATEIRKQQTQLSGTDIAKTSGGGMVGAGDLGKELMSLRSRIKESNNNLANFGSGIDTTGDKAKKLGDKFAEAQKENDNLKKQYKQVEGALKSYTNIQERLSVVTQELTRLQEIRAAKEKTMDDLAFGSDEDRDKFADSVGSLQQALAQGLESLGGDERRDVKALLDSMADGQVFAGTGQTKEEMLTQLRGGQGSMIQRLGGAAWQTEDAKGRMGLVASKEERDKIDEAKGIMQEGEDAAAALIEPMKAQAQELNEILATIHENFLTKFQQILEEQFQTREEKEKAAQEGKMGADTERRAAMEKVLKSVVGEKKFGDMKDKDKDVMIKALKGQEGNIETVLGGKERIKMAGGAAELMAGGKDSFDKSIEAFGDGYIDDYEIEGGAMGQNFLDAMEAEIQKHGAAKAAEMGYKGEDVQKVIDETMRGFNEWKEQMGGGVGLGALGWEPDEIFASFDASMKARETAEKDKVKDATKEFRTDMTGAGFSQEEQMKFLNKDFSEKILTDLEKFSQSDSFTKLGESIENATERINQATDNIDASKAEAESVEGRADTYKSRGGVIYASRGRFIPRGTDTIPAMLTPGEFVVRRQAVKSVGVPFLKALNAQGAKGIAKGFSKGGAAYLAGGGMGVSLDSTAFDASVNRFSNHITELGEVLGKGFNVQVAGKVDVVVHIPAADTLAGIKGSVGVMVDNKITQGINDMLAKNFPQIARQSSLTKVPLRPMEQS